MNFRPALLCLLSVSLLQAQTKRRFAKSPTPAPQPAIALAHDLRVHLLLANSAVRVYRIDLDPGSETAVDQHDHDFLLISLGSNEFDLAGFGNVYPMTMNNNDVQVLKGHWPHRVVNKSKNPLHLIEVETTREIQPDHAICGLVAQSCTGARFAKDDENNYVQSTLFITPTTQLGKIEIQASAAMPEHSHKGSFLMIALNDQKLQDAIQDGSTKDINAHAGDPTWDSGEEHRVFNIGSQPADFLALEWR